MEQRAGRVERQRADAAGGRGHRNLLPFSAGIFDWIDGVKGESLTLVLDVGWVAALDQAADDGDDATTQIGLVELVVDAADRERAVATHATGIAHRQRSADLGFGQRIGARSAAE